MKFNPFELFFLLLLVFTIGRAASHFLRREHPSRQETVQIIYFIIAVLVIAGAWYAYRVVGNFFLIG